MGDNDERKKLHLLDGIDFDPSALQRQVGPAPNVLAELFALYSETCRAASAELKRALEGGDHDSAHRHAHKLKSSSSSVGAIALGALCARIELATESPEPIALGALAAELEQESGRALKWIEDMAAQAAERA